jgi:hypothetical protein
MMPDPIATPPNKALHQTRRGGAAASRPVVEARLAGEGWCSTDVGWMKRLLAACIAISLLGATPPPEKRLELRHFKEDHLTGAGYLRVSSIGTYEVIFREHMGIFMMDHGTWSDKEGIWHFASAKKGRGAFTGRVIKMAAHTFIVWTGKDAPISGIPENEIREDLAKDGTQLPSYVFFEISQEIFERETKKRYPFKYFPQMNDGK